MPCRNIALAGTAIGVPCRNSAPRADKATNAFKSAHSANAHSGRSASKKGKSNNSKSMCTWREPHWSCPGVGIALAHRHSVARVSCVDPTAMAHCHPTSHKTTWRSLSFTLSMCEPSTFPARGTKPFAKPSDQTEVTSMSSSSLPFLSQFPSYIVRKLYQNAIYTNI